MWELGRGLIDGGLVASLDETAAAVRMLAERARVVAEGAGGARARRGARGPGGQRPGRLHRLGRQHRRRAPAQRARRRHPVVAQRDPTGGSSLDVALPDDHNRENLLSKAHAHEATSRVSTDNVAAVRRSYEAFSRGDLDGALAMMDDSIVWHQAQGLPHGGIYEGLPAVRASVFDPLDAQWWEGFDATPTEMLGGDDHVVVIGRYTGRAKGIGTAARHPVRPRLEVRARQGSAVPPVHRHARLDRRARLSNRDAGHHRRRPRYAHVPVPPRRSGS